MMDGRYRALPGSVRTAFCGVLLVDVVVGVLSGVGAINGLALLVAVFGGLSIFVPWAVSRLDPRGVSELAIYAKDQAKAESDSRR